MEKLDRMGVRLTFFMLIVYFTAVSGLFGQSLQGKIYDKETEQPLDGATVYFDGTTALTITNDEGFFTISGNGNSSNDLVISYIGYTTYRISNPFAYSGKAMKIYLYKSETKLDEVVISRSPFSRKQLLEVFRKQFLGESKAGKSCEILNEDDIDIYYDVSNNTLNASSDNALRIRNNFLKYEVRFDQLEFKLNYYTTSIAAFDIRRSAYAGSTVFIDLSKNGAADKKRLKSYLGSSAHLMRTISNNNNWESQPFSLFVGDSKINPSEYFKVTDTLNVKKIRLIKVPKAMKIGKDGVKTMEKTYFSVFYKNADFSGMEFVAPKILVDDNGNYAPVYGVVFGGYLGSLKAGDLLPRDYYESIKDIINK
ncbi:carboxypeptidase-like regulatory domain-containing protein [Flavobacterium sp.]|uniref:carboxypeptidase-like regulatory domain-containing protein n=1 Tax=Flavobacterium sp. TaxID=239 RepID=UPI0026110AE1|nr:carboxypeptidase-like regulatory domain-containing protein [Flavobacterium sp.]